MTDEELLITRARIAAGTSWTGEDDGHGNRTENQEPAVRQILRACADALEKQVEFITRIDRQLHSHLAGWQEHESAAWTTSAGGRREGEPDFSHKCQVDQHLTRPGPADFPAPSWWRWTVRVRSGGVSYRARGYVQSMTEGKAACEAAVHMLASGIFAQFKGQHP